MTKKKITSFKAFHKLVPQIIEELARDDALAVRAAVNPLLAFEELGYSLTPEVQKRVEHILRFPPKTRKRLQELEEDIHKIAGKKFDIDNEEDINKLLFQQLKLTRPKGRLAVVSEEVIRQGSEFVKGKRPQWSDPLQAQEKAHAIMPPLLAYRKLMAERSGFAPRKLYEQLKSGQRKLPVSKIRINFPDQHEEYDDA